MGKMVAALAHQIRTPLSFAMSVMAGHFKSQIWQPVYAFKLFANKL